MIRRLCFKMSNQAADMPQQKDSRRVPKPLMEKRRRDRINQSLETLRILLLENTHNEKLKNPKVEKAEILESVVHFLRAEQGSETDPHQINRGKRGRTEESDEDLQSPCKRQSYRNGMRTCLLRVSHFIASKSHEFGQGAEKACENLQHKPLERPVQTLSTMSATPLQRETQMHLYDESSLLAQQHLTHVQLGNSCPPSSCSKLAKRTVLSVPTMTSSSKQPVMLCDPVWRPWPQ